MMFFCCPCGRGFCLGDALLHTQFTRDLTLNIPLLSAAMDTVTGADTAICLAQAGGVGVIHRNMAPDLQAKEVNRVKKFESGVISDPVCVGKRAKVRDVLDLMRKYNISGVPVVDGARAIGIVTNRDLRFEKSMDTPVSKVMTPQEKLVTVREGTASEEVENLLHQHRIEKVLVVDSGGDLKGLITVKDIQKSTDFPNACKDHAGRLLAAAAVGVGEDADERVELLVGVGVDAIVVDTAHGHAKGVLERVADDKKIAWRCAGYRRQYRHRRSGARLGKSRRRRRKSRHRSRLNMHHAHRRRGRRAASPRHHGSATRTG